MTASTQDPIEVWSPATTAKMLGLHKNTLRKYTQQGIGPKMVVLGPGRKGYRPSEVRDWLASQQQEIQVGHDAQERAALAVLAGVKKNIIDNDPQGMLGALRGSSREVSLRLAEATNIISYLCRLSDRPEQMLVALVERVTAVDNTD